MTIENDRGKQYKVNWCSSAVSPGELWINLPFDGCISDAAEDFEDSEVFVAIDEQGEQVRYEGYTQLTNAMLDAANKQLTLRVGRAP